MKRIATRIVNINTVAEMVSKKTPNRRVNSITEALALIRRGVEVAYNSTKIISRKFMKQ